MDSQVVVDLVPPGQKVRNVIQKLHSETLWERDGEMPWDEFARVFAAEKARATAAEASRPREDEESEAAMFARIERVTRYAMREILDPDGKVLRSQLVTALLESINRHGVPYEIVHALVLHDTDPKFGLGGLNDDTVDPGKYTLVTEVLLPNGPNVLEKAYKETNAIEWPWHPSAEIRSTSVGDVIVLFSPDHAHCTAHQVRMIGFEEVQFAKKG